VPALFSEKKLHAFRVQCTNVLGSTGASDAERECHIGWQSTVQSRHYASLKHTALNARTSLLLAGRSGRDDPPHPMWQCLARAPGDEYWQRVRFSFREWVREHRSEATKLAGRFVARLLRNKAANQSVGYTARLHVAAWKAYGVSVEQSVLDELSRLTRERWRPATMSRLSALGARKSDQFDLLETHWSALVEYLGSTSGEQFADHCRAAQPSQPTSIACELAYLSRKAEAEIAQALLRTRAFVSLLRCTGMRSITAVTLRLDHFTEVGDGGSCF
jgi:hypothetical protein